MIEVAAPPGVVWSVLVDIEGWPSWNPAIREVSLDGDLEVGTHFRWSTGPGTVTSRLAHVQAPSAIAWNGSFMTLSHAQRWDIEPSPNGSRVSVRTSLSGPVARLLSRRLKSGQRGVLDAWLGLLRLEAETRRPT
jgi:uncharacterized protein YndB with AHSA1/START domain